ncbi:Formaldehyde dismutase [Aquisphaera giovannonii]|uniref:Formaldehyde dismutase n=1 Tax=Aquisphaera giovannonii TaxID=406548 RepID=A0A5B9WEY1_9BACT|nr:zinc-dependent alcohol dehydrogenase [Aquisphaera giovannonii]QEH38809.1 Formaldehyde dismutase [Aquisphaera giovannonii]
MRANTFVSPGKTRVERVPDPKILNDQDAIVRITSTAICGSDLHLYNGFIPTVEPGDIFGHEFMGEVVEVGKGTRKVKKGDRVVVAFPIACGSCYQCGRQMYSCCENSNPNAWIAEKLMGHSPAGVFGYSHMMGGFAGGQAEYARVPFADVGTIKVPDGMTDEQVLFLSDIFPTGYMGAEMCDIKPGDVIAVWGCGPVGLFAMASAYLLGAERVIGIDRVEARLRVAREKVKAETINYEEHDVYRTLMEMTGGRGPDSVIDAVGMEAHGSTAMFLVDRVKQGLMLENDRPNVLRDAIMCCRSGGTVSVVGVYSGLIDKFPMGSVMNRSLRIMTGQCHVQRYMKPLLERIRKGEIDPTFLITHRANLDDAPAMYRTFRDKQDECIKVVLKP